MLLPGRPLGRGAAEYHVLDLGRIDPGALDRVLDHMPPRVAPWVMLNAPRNALPIGVRAVDTMTASDIRRSLK